MEQNTEQHPYQYFFKEQVSPAIMDRLWEDGWRHFGIYFFRDMQSANEDGSLKIVRPLRINLQGFELGKQHKKILKKAQNTHTIFRPVVIDDEKLVMFDKHIKRFKSNPPESIYNFMSQSPADTPCQMLECCLFDEKDYMYAVSFLDVGEKASSSVYAMFDIEYSHLSPGIHTLLEEIKFSQTIGMSYLYTGYAYSETSFYDYKKRFSATEYYDWQGRWQALPTKWVSK
jgi:leucyl-tRNA---protein transferase